MSHSLRLSLVHRRGWRGGSRLSWEQKFAELTSHAISTASTRKDIPA